VMSDQASMVLLPLLAALLLLVSGSTASAPAHVISSPTVTVSAGAGRSITLEAVGTAPAFRVGVASASATAAAALPTLMLPPGPPTSAPTNVKVAKWPAAGGLGAGVGLRASFGAVYLANLTATQDTHLVLLDAAGSEIIRSALLAPAPAPAPAAAARMASSRAVPSCESAGEPNTDQAKAGKRLKASVEDLKSDCCAACTAFAGCGAWIFATDAAAGEDNCWLLDSVTETKHAPGRILGRIGGATQSGLQLSLGAHPDGRSYGFGGADQEPGVEGCEKTPFLRRFSISKHDQFTKTGSGHTSESVE